jgi:nicotinamide-nucleotide amidase
MSSTQITASILTIGDELLIGQTIDTNSAWMAQELNRIGIWVRRRVAVGDERSAIWEALDQELKDADILLITGGLGPTADDITKPLLCDYFGGKMVVNQQALEHVRRVFEEILKRPLLERNLKQAEVPDNCEVLLNKRGTAPGMWFLQEANNHRGKRIIISLPGVPHEMKGLMTDLVLEKLKTSFQLPIILHRTLLTAGAGESFIAERIQNWEAELPPSVKLAYLPSFGMVRLRLTGTVTIENLKEFPIDRLFEELKEKVQDILVVDQDIRLEEKMGQLLIASGKTIATAESCSGGYIAHLLTSVPGSSAYYKGSVVAYSYDAKEKLLGVAPQTLLSKGAVSKETVEEMLHGLLKNTGADVGIATSGIMGPEGGTPDKPVGTAWVAVGTLKNTITTCFHFRFDRLKNIQLTAAHALLFLMRFLQQEEI